MKNSLLECTALAWALVLGSAMSAGCVTTAEPGGKSSWPPITAEVRIGIGGNRETSVTGRAPDGKCILIKFTGSSGELLGTSMISVPDSVQVPAGTVHQHFQFVDCPDPAAPGSTPPNSPEQTGLRWHEVFSQPITTDALFAGAPICHARVLCGPGQDAHDLLRPILAAGPGAPVPAHVDVKFFAEAEVGATGATIRFASREPITSFVFDWNEIPAFADLNGGVNASLLALPNGWHAVESSIDVADITRVAKEWNRGAVTMRTLPASDIETYGLGFQNP